MVFKIMPGCKRNPSHHEVDNIHEEEFPTKYLPYASKKIITCTCGWKTPSPAWITYFYAFKAYFRDHLEFETDIAVGKAKYQMNLMGLN